MRGSAHSYDLGSFKAMSATARRMFELVSAGSVGRVQMVYDPQRCNTILLHVANRLPKDRARRR